MTNAKKEIAQKALNNYTFSCTQANGTTERMRENKAVFTGCKDFKLVKLI